MRWILITALAALVLSTPKANAQLGFAIIRDSDGFANIRSSPAIKGEVTGKVLHDSMVYVFGEENGWLSISYRSDGKERSGFVHSSRANRIDSLTQISSTAHREDQITFKSDSIQVKIETEEFDAKKLPVTIERFPDGLEFVQKIDGKIFWGTDGGLPDSKYKSINVTRGPRTFALPAEATEGLFQPNVDPRWTSVYFDESTDTTFITASNSDGAGGYAVVLRIAKGEFRDRLIISGF